MRPLVLCQGPWSLAHQEPCVLVCSLSQIGCENFVSCLISLGRFFFRTISLFSSFEASVRAISTM